MAHAPATALTHADLGPDHLLGGGDDVTGVIDWTDTVIGDPALDLAWGLHGSSPEFAAALAAAYQPEADLVRRARVWHQLGPWHEVTYGLDTEQRDLVESGLAGVLARLATND
jgi:aminoglycoside phosphotransferase (APT) family kinase protein